MPDGPNKPKGPDVLADSCQDGRYGSYYKLEKSKVVTNAPQFLRPGATLMAKSDSEPKCPARGLSQPQFPHSYLHLRCVHLQSRGLRDHYARDEGARDEVEQKGLCYCLWLL